MSKPTVLITGCQRSGTTLLRLILDAHPDIKIIDEDKFNYVLINTYLNANQKYSLVGFKLPRYAQILEFIRGLPEPRILWCIRHPVDVVCSMVNLQISSAEHGEISWAVDPACAQAEIINCYWVLPEQVKVDLNPHMTKFQHILKIPPTERSRMDMIFYGALCWRVKHELLSVYKAGNIDYHCISYEDLVSQPELPLQKILAYIGAEWHENLLKHHEIHQGTSVGNTPNTRPIDNKSINRGIKTLPPDELALINSICGEMASRLGYSIYPTE